MAQITLYGSKVSPFSEKIELALREGKIAHKYCEVDLTNKPAFFTGKITAIGKVPAISYGGPDVAPEDPSPLSVKLAESNVILEFLADTYPEANLMPTNPIERAKIRFFMETISSKLVPSLIAWLTNSEPQAAENLLKALESAQALLPENSQYVVGNSYTIADACLLPFIQRIQVSCQYDIGKFAAGNGPKFGESLKDAKFAKLNVYVDAANNRAVAKQVFSAEAIKDAWNNIFGRR